MKVQSVVLMLRCMEDERVYRALVRLYSDGADYADEGSSAHPVVISSPRKKKKKKKPTTPNPLGRTRQTLRSTTCVFPPCSVSLVGKESVSTSNTYAYSTRKAQIFGTKA